ncbi:MAG: aminopeptidase P family protein [Clostridia bacterium]|nr:aminopeptidase P family protein [Clostridia bacterium]
MNPIERLTQKVINGDTKKAALIHSAPNRYYLTSFPSSDGVLLLTAEKAYYLLDFRYAEAARAKAQGAEVVDFRSLDETIKELLTKHGVTAVYMEYAAIPYGVAKRYEKICEDSGAEAVLDTTLDAAIRAQRIIKSEEEIQRICDAQAITDATFTHILNFIREGVTEREVALEIEFHMRKLGADGNAFDPIVVTGTNGSQCHGVPGDTVIKKGDLITMDTGAMLRGYHSDMTRTVAVGYVSDEQREIYDTVLKAQVAAIDAIHAGVRCCDIDKVARDIIETPYPGTFGHSLGHGVGFEIHEWPGFSTRDTTIAEPGMVITVEPGIYIEGKCGVRIEDMIAVTETGCRNLTHSPKELIIL